MRPRIYVDTSLFGGCEDIEAIGHSRRLVAAMVAGDYSMVISEVTLLELEKAPAVVRAHLERVPESLVQVRALDAEAEALTAEYIHDGAVGKNERADALHIALATTARADVARRSRWLFLDAAAAAGFAALAAGYRLPQPE